MSYENIRFPRDHMAIYDGDFFYFDERNDTLNRKDCDGATSFVYPLDTTLGSNKVKSMEYDGYYFWTMQQGSTSLDSIIKKWVIDNFVCTLVDVIDLSHTAENKFSCSSFALEFYNTKLVTTVSKHSSILSLSTYYDKVSPGTIITLGPNEDGMYEDVTVTGTLSSPNTFGLDFYTFNTYQENTNVYFSKSLWLINSFTYNTAKGSLYKLSLITKQIEYVIEDDDFKYVETNCFYNAGNSQYILYVLNTSIRFFNIETNTHEESMIIDNLESNSSTVIPVKDIKVEADSIYRLQQKANYYGIVYSWATYNYQLSTIRPFVDSISMDVYPKILPSNGINVAEIMVVVRDQFDNPLKLKPVFLQDSDDIGFITSETVYTNLFGTAISYYKAGTVPNTITLNTIVTQYD